MSDKDNEKIGISIYVSRKDKKILSEAAFKSRLSLSAWMVQAAFEKIERDRKEK